MCDGGRASEREVARVGRKEGRRLSPAHVRPAKEVGLFERDPLTLHVAASDRETARHERVPHRQWQVKLIMSVVVGLAHYHVCYATTALLCVKQVPDDTLKISITETIVVRGRGWRRVSGFRDPFALLRAGSTACLSNPRSFIGWQARPIDLQPAAAFLFRCVGSGVLGAA